jgi:DNA-nicking Smr family endonuclease
MTSKKKPPTGSPFAQLEALRAKVKDEEAQQAKKAKTPERAPEKRPHDKRPAPGRAGQAASGPSEEGEADALAFHRMVAGVTPLDRTNARISRSQTRLEPSRADSLRERGQAVEKDEAEIVHEHLRALVEGGTRFEVSDDGRCVEGRRVDVPADWVRKLRRGLLPIDARLDLHGLRTDDARARLAEFLEAKRKDGERCVLVVHGKGEHSPRGVGVLRGEIAAWLSQGSSSVHVAAFSTARDDDGGEGAVYVLLRR